MKNKMIYYFLFVALLFSSCKHDEFDAEYAARQYCNCLQREREVEKDFFEARTTCDGEQLVNNRFFRLDYMNMNIEYRNYMLFVSQGLGDSLADFHMKFYDYVLKHCCKEGVMGCDKGDSLQSKMRAIDSIYRKSK